MELAQGRYRLIRRIGAGGAGVVFAAADSLLGRTVAIKALHSSFDSALLHREAQSLARLNHPGVVALHDLIEQEGRPYLVMEYVDGCNLEQWLSERPPLDPEDALALFARIASIVADAHRSGMLHCDLKPSNVLLASSGEVKLSDFTLARSTESGGPPAPLGGTDGYTAPEVLTGATIDAGADIFSLGAILRCLTAAPINGTPQHAQVRAAVHRALSPERAERFATVDEMLASLPPAPTDVTQIAGRSILADLTRILPRYGRRVQAPKHRVLGPLATVCAALMIAGAALFLRLPAAASPARVTLPNLVATQTNSAQLVARSLQLQYRAMYVYSSTVPAGVVLEQRPAPNTQLDKHGIVTVTVSKGPAPVPVPDLNGISVDTATAEAGRLGFHVSTQRQDSLGTPAGIVLGQFPAPHTMRLPGATVTLTVSQKPWWDVFGW